MSNKKNEKLMNTTEVHDSSLHLSPTLPKDDDHRISVPIDHPDSSIPPSKLDIVNQPSEDKILAYTKEDKLKWIEEKKMKEHDGTFHISPTLPSDDIHRTSIPIDHPDYSIPLETKCIGEITDKQHGLKKEGLHKDSHYRLHDLSNIKDHRGEITDIQHGIRKEGLHKDSHKRKHKLSSKEDHEGKITIEQHGTMIKIPDAHHKALHAKSHLEGGKDELPWGEGGGLDADTVDGLHASELRTPLYAGAIGKNRFIELDDTPSTYSGQAGKYPRVKSDETGLEFATAAGVGTFKELTDTPDTYTTHGGKHVTVKDTEDGLEFSIHDKTVHDALNIDADTLDTKHYSDISAEIDNDIAVHKSDASAHHIKTGHDEVRGLLAQGLEADRPTAGIAGRLYYASIQGADIFKKDGTVDMTGYGLIKGSKVEIDDISTYIDKDASNNMIFTDAVTGTKTLAELAAPGVDTFLELTDTPSSYAGQAGKFARVNSAENALEFAAGAAGVSVESFKTTGYGSLGTGGVWADLLTLNITLSNDSTCWIFANIPRVACPKGYITQFRILIDDETESYLRGFYKHTSGSYVDSWSDYKTVTVMRIESLTAGSHTLKLQWNTQSATAYAGSSSALVILGVIAWG